MIIILYIQKNKLKLKRDGDEYYNEMERDIIISLG